MTLQNEKFEELIASELARTLDPQRGRAAAAFRTQIAADRAAHIAGGSKNKTSWARRQVSRAGSLFWIGLPTAAAAAIALAVTLRFSAPPGAVNPPRNDDNSIASNNPSPLGGSQSGDQLPVDDGQLVTATGIVQETPGDVHILAQPRVIDTRPPIRTTEYIEPAVPYPLNRPGTPRQP